MDNVLWMNKSNLVEIKEEQPEVQPAEKRGFSQQRVETAEITKKDRGPAG